MKITRVRTVPVWCPRRRAYGGVTRTALGAAAVSDYTIVFVETDAGVTGIGEVASVFKRRGAALRRDAGVLRKCRKASPSPLRGGDRGRGSCGFRASEGPPTRSRDALGLRPSAARLPPAIRAQLESVITSRCSLTPINAGHREIRPQT